MEIGRKLISSLLVASMLASMSIPAMAKQDAESADNSTMTSQGSIWEAHDIQAQNKDLDMHEVSRYSDVETLSNSYLEFAVDTNNRDVNSGRFTIGNTGGNPNFASDNNKILLFGHPSPWSSYTTIHINGTNYIFRAESTEVDRTNLRSVSTMEVDGVVVTQTIQIVHNDTTDADDTVQITYDAKNQSGASKNIGVRIMVDTMLGGNDGAPFKVPSVGNVTTEIELNGAEIPQYWQAFDSLTDASVFAVGTLYQAGDLRPDKVQFTNWNHVYRASDSWDYEVQENYPVTGDSAVSMYWNPRSVSNNGTLTTSTYYGVGYTGVDGSEVGMEATIPEDCYAVRVLDGDTLLPLVGATITDGTSTKTSDENGIVVFGPVSEIGPFSLSVSNAGYITRSVSFSPIIGSCGIIPLYQERTTAQITDVTGTIDGKTVDLMNGYQYFKSNQDGLEVNPDKTNVKPYTIQVTHTKEAGSYQLIQSGEIIANSEEGRFTLAVFTGTEEDPDSYGTQWRIDKLKEGKVVSVRILDDDGRMLDEVDLGIRVSRPTTHSNVDDSGELSVGEELTISVPDNIPIVGGTEFELGMKELPFFAEISYDGKVKFGINVINDSEEQTALDWESVQEDYNEIIEKIATGRMNAGAAFGGKPQKFGAGKLEVDANVMGYGEGYINEAGYVTVNVGVVATISQSGEYTQTFFLGYVPVYVAVGEKVTLTGTAQVSVDNTGGRIHVTGGLGEINPELTLNVDGGVGMNGVLDVGASGRATISWLNRFSDNYNRVDLTGELYLVATAWLFKAEKKLASGSWTLYDSYGHATRLPLLVDDFEMTDSNQYMLISREYLNAITPFSATASNGATIVKSAVFPAAAPKLVQAGDTSYLFWLDDDGTRSAENRTSLVYATSKDCTIWSAPEKVYQTSETAEFSFDVCVDNMNTVHIVLMKANQSFDTNASLDDMANGSEIHYAKIISGSGASSIRLTDNAIPDMMPKITASGANVTVAWATTTGNDVLTGNGQYQICYVTNPGASDAEVATMQVTGAVSFLDVGSLDNTPTIAYTLDTDNNFTTVDDSTLSVYHIGEDAEVISVNGDSVSNPMFASLNHVDTLFWYEGGNIYYLKDGIKTPVFGNDQMPTSLNSNFNILGNKVIWEAMSSKYEDTTALYAVEYHNGTWGIPYQMFETDSTLSSSFNGYAKDGMDYVVYLCTEDAINSDTTTSIRVVRVEKYTDIALVNVGYDMKEAKPGSELALEVTIENTGSKPVDTIRVTVENSSFSIENAGLQPGETKKYTISGYSLPDSIAGKTDITITATTEGDTTSSNNDSTITVGYTDLSVSVEKTLVNGDEWAQITVSNSSVFPASGILNIFSDDVDGAIIYQDNISNITSGANRSILINLSELTSVNVDTFYITITPMGDSDLNAVNNSTTLYLGSIADESDYQYNLTLLAEEGGQIISDVTGYYHADDVITLSAEAETGYHFAGWISSGAGTFADATKATTEFTMPAEDVSITAQFEKDSDGEDETPTPNPNPNPGGGSTGGSGSSGSSGSTIGSSTSLVKVQANVNGSVASVTISNSNLLKNVNAALEESAQPTVTITVNGMESSSALKLTLPVPALTTLGKAKGSLTVESGIVEITLDSRVLTALDDAKGNTVTLTVAPVDSEDLTSAQTDAVNGAPVYNLTLMSMGAPVDFNGGVATVTLPHTLDAEQNADGVVVFYLTDDGKLEACETVYSDSNKTVTFKTTHFSKYVVGYDAVLGWKNPYVDVNNGDWFYSAVRSTSMNGLMTGVSDTEFAPNATTTRGILVTVLHALAGKPTADHAGFADVPVGEWYTDAVNWAYQSGITAGTSDTTFSPNAPLTREQTVTMLAAYAKAQGLEVTAQGDLSACPDADRISSYALLPMTWAVKNGLLTGNERQELMPQGITSRAQLAAILVQAVARFQ